MVHLTQKQIEAYCKHELPVAEVLSVSDHLGACDVCRRQIEASGNGDATFFSLRTQVFEETTETTTHLTMDQAAAYVDRHLTGEELRSVDDHLTHCDDCILAVNDLRDFRNEIAPSLDREFRPTTVPSPAQTVSSRGWFGSLASVFRMSPVAAFGSAALAMVLLAVIAWLVLRTPQDQEPQIAHTPTPASQPSMPPPDAPQPDAPAPVAVVAQLNDGSKVLTLDQQGKLSGADQLPPAYQDLLKKTLSSGTIEKSSQLQGLTRPSSSLMGTNQQNDFSVLEPMGNVLLTNRPTFRWTGMEGATGYVVEMYDEKFMPVISSPQLTTLTWTTTVPRGHVYSWQVKALKDGQEITSPRPPAPQAKFRVVDQAKANELAQARRAYPSSHLTLGLLYADAGLLREAEQEFRQLQRANPNSELARKLLRQVQSLRR